MQLVYRNMDIVRKLEGSWIELTGQTKQFYGAGTDAEAGIELDWDLGYNK